MKPSSKQPAKPDRLWTGYASLDSGVGLIIGFIVGLIFFVLVGGIGDWVQKPPRTDTARHTILAFAAVLSGTVCSAAGRRWPVIGWFAAVGASLPLLFFVIEDMLFSGMTTP